MCLAVAAQILTLNDDRTATAEYMGNRLTIDVGLIAVNPGDFVLVHAGLAVEVISAAAAKDISDLYQELEAAVHDGRS